MKKSDFLKPLINKYFLKIWAGQFFSLISAYTLNFILIGKIFSSTQSSIAVGLFLFFNYLPTMLVGPFAGVFVDNWNKRSIFIFSSLIQSAIILTYILLRQKIWPIYCLILIYSLCDEFYNPAVAASIPMVIAKKMLPAANSLFFLTIQGTTIIGYFLGGVILKLFGQSNLVFYLISLFLLIGTIVSISLPANLFRGQQKLKINLIDFSNLSRALNLPLFWEQTKEGYRFIKNEPLVFFPILLLAGLQSLIGMGLIIFPALAQIFKIEFADSSFFLILPAVFGALIGGGLSGKVIKRLRKYVFILGGLIACGVFLIMLSILSLLVSRPIFLVAPIILLMGISYVFIYIPLQTLIQEKTPIDVRGRVFGILSTLVTLVSALPMLITTTLVDLLGIRLMLVILGLSLVFLAIFAYQKKQLILLSSNQNRKNGI